MFRRKKYRVVVEYDRHCMIENVIIRDHLTMSGSTLKSISDYLVIARDMLLGEFNDPDELCEINDQAELISLKVVEITCHPTPIGKIKK